MCELPRGAISPRADIYFLLIHSVGAGTVPLSCKGNLLRKVATLIPTTTCVGTSTTNGQRSVDDSVTV